MKKLGLSPKKFLVLFALLTAALLFASDSLDRHFMQLFNDGVLTAHQALALVLVTLLAASGITVFVGVKYIQHLRPSSRKSVRGFGRFTFVI